MKHKQLLEELKKQVLVFDIETCATNPATGKPIDIRTDFDMYVEHAKCKFFGCYSYKYNKYVCDVVKGNEDKIKRFIAEHSILVGFNNQEFDTPITAYNGLMDENSYFNQVDLLIILGAMNYQTHAGLPYKNRGALMGYKFPRNSLRVIAETMGCETKKGDIDYMIFFQDEFTDEEYQSIMEYLEADVKATKEMFDKLWDFWEPFTEFLHEKDVGNLSWLKSSISSLTYKAACNTMGVEDTYGERGPEKTEHMGGRVLEPKYEEARDVWYVDFTSLYPHMFCMFNLFNEIVATEDTSVEEIASGLDVFSGNELFQVRGTYAIDQQHPLSKDVAEKLKLRKQIKKEIKETGVYNSLEYAIKIFLNSLYGATRSEVFEQIHTPNAGWDCCWLGQQINHLTEKMMDEMGFETIAGDTDSIFVVARNKEHDNEAYVKECLKKVVDKIKANVPFPAETYNIDIEARLDYVMWPFSFQPIVDPETGENVKEGRRLVKERRGKKKNYCYIIKENEDVKVKIMGMPIKKDGSTRLGPKIFEETLLPLIKQQMTAKFDKKFIDTLLETELQKKDNLALLAREYKVKPFNTYKKENQIQAQISQGYFNGQDGVIWLIKNKKVGKAGKTAKYCTVEEAVEAKLTTKDLDLVKIKNELEPFVRYEENGK